MADSGINDQLIKMHSTHSWIKCVLSSSISYFVVYCFQRKMFNTTKLSNPMVPFVELILQSDTDNHSVMQQFGASVFYTEVRWHKLGEVDSECTLHIFIVLAICVPKIIKFGGDLTKLWQKQVGSFFGTPCSLYVVQIQLKVVLSWRLKLTVILW